MKTTFLVAVAVLLFCNPLIASAEQYLWVTEHATGFSYDKTSKEWKNTNFTPEHKYIIAKSKYKAYSYQVNELGEDDPASFCKEGFNQYGYLFCQEGYIHTEFRFNKKNGRFLAVSPYGYYNAMPGEAKVTDETSDTPLIEIGKCSPF